MATKVEDDIDIEEHDILENPRILNLLPDLCSVKDEEIPDLESQDHMTNNESLPRTEPSTDVEHQPERSETFVGSQFSGFNVTVHLESIKEEPSDTAPDNTEHIPPVLDNNPSANDVVHVENNHIDLIVNSNRSTETVDGVTHTGTRKSIRSFVNLEDCGPRLQNNPCFCIECKILFRTISSYVAHDMIYHDQKKFLTELKKSASKTRQSADNTVVHEQFTEMAEKIALKENHNTSDGGEVCNHCNVTFSDSETLISHLYEILIIESDDDVGNKPEASTPENQNEQVPDICDQTEKEISTSDSEQTTDAEQEEEKLPRVLTSSYYCCDICCAYFKFLLRVVNHMSTSHAIDAGGFTVEPFNPQCRFCLDIFKSASTYNRHVENFHREKFLEKVNDTVVNSLQLIQRHDIQILHVPKSVLFQCRQCSIHFISFEDANRHTKKCPNKKVPWKCYICKRFFESEDQKKHLLQHRLNSEEFNVYLVENNTLGKILNKCAECETYLDESNFTKHCSTACKREFEKCALCELDIHSSSIKEHNKRHKIMSKQNNFIIVELAKLENCDIERLISEVSTNTKTGPTLPLKVYHCAKCGTCSIGSRRESHVADTCKTLQQKSIIICNTCGLVTSGENHRKFHSKYPNITIMDMQFFDVDTQELITPPFPPFPRCTKCQVYLCRKRGDKRHSCKDPYRACKRCKGKFMDLAYKLHIQYHQYAARMTSSSTENTETALLPNTPEEALPTNSITKSLPTQSLPSRQKTPNQEKEKLSSLWDVLYRCNACDVIYDSYEKTVEHCQKHITNMESHGVVVKHCEICCLKFDSSCFDVHERLHAQNQEIKKDTFRIVIFNYGHILSAYWLYSLRIQLAEINEIMANSIYSHTRKLKLRLVQDGDPESTQYKCCKCEKYVNPYKVFSHCQKICDKNVPGFVCTICKCQCATAITRSQHVTLHKQFEHLRIVYFNEQGDEEFNKKLAENDARKSFKGVPSIQNKVHYYKCNSCERCTPALRNSLVKHICLRHPQVLCVKCNLSFGRGLGYDQHMQLHKSNPNFNRKHIEITDFIPACKSETNSVVVISTKNNKNKTNSSTNRVTSIKDGPLTLYRCSCDIHFTSKSAALEHIKVCDPKSDFIKEECSKCKRKFDPTELETHRREHHKGNNRAKLNIILLKPPKEMKSLLHHCKQCDVYFLSTGGMASHVSSGHKTNLFKSCDYCMYKFRKKTSLKRHFWLHHSTNNPEKTSSKQNKWLYKVPVFTQKMLKKLNMKFFSSTLYKCKTCNGHFLTYGGLYSHLLNKSHFKHVDKCDICQYEFSETNMKKHHYVHHERMNLQRDDFVIVAKE